MAQTNYFHAKYEPKLIGLFSVVDLFTLEIDSMKPMFGNVKVT